MRSSCWAAFVGLCLAVAGVSRPAAADPSELTAHLTWSRAAEADACPASQDLENAVERRLARKVFVPPEAADRRLSGWVRGASARWEVELVLMDARGRRLGSRKLTSLAASCQAMTADVALIIALLVDLPKQTVELTLPARASEPVVARPAQPARPKVPPRPELPATKSSEVDVGAFGTAGYGLFPGLHGGGGLLAALRVAGAPKLELGLKATAPTETSQAGPGARFFGASSHLLACLPISPGSSGLELAPCAGAELGLLQVEGIRLSHGRSSVQPLLNAVADMRLLMPTGGGTFIQLGLGGSFVVRRDRFTYGSSDGTRNEVHRPAALVPTAHLGFVTRLPISP